MYVGKRVKSILSVLLICGLLVVSVPSRIHAAAPLVLTPALKYAIGAGIVAGGLYAANNDDLTYAINDYWNKASDYVKSMWNNAVIYGTSIGTILLNDSLKSSIKDYLDTYYHSGLNTIEEPGVVNPSNGKYRTIHAPNGDIYGFTMIAAGSYKDVYKTKNGDLVAWVIARWEGSEPGLLERFHNAYYRLNGDSVEFCMKRLDGSLFFINVLPASLFGYGVSANVTRTYTGDADGFGTALSPDQEVKVPCPPIPADQWPDNWIDDLQEEMNRTGNPTLDDETSIEEWEDEYEWYLDEFGNIYKVKKGKQPKKPEDEPLRIPGPPFPAPDVPENYPTEDEPDLTVEHHPPQTTVTENPDGSRTETTTQTTTTTKKWWDPSSQRWRTTTTDTTTTTTVDFAPDGTETGRTTTTTTQPKGEREETAQPDDTAIDWEPLRRGLFELTEKFPFCLPWDLMRGIQSLESSQWDRKIRIEVGDGIWPAMVIDLTMFDGIASITRVILLIVFDLGLIFGTRKLMGGDV